MVKVFLDPGHGGHDPGAVGYGLEEKNVALNIAKRTRRILVNNWKNVNVRLSREDDTFVSLSGRADDANDWGAHSYVSIHLNAGGAFGFESYIHDSLNNSKLQDHVHREVMEQINSKAPNASDRGQKKANFAVLRETTMHAVLTENLFIDHERSAELLNMPRFLEAVARGHARGIAQFHNLDRKDDEDVQPNDGIDIPEEWWTQIPLWVDWQGNRTDETMPIWQVLQQARAASVFAFHQNRKMLNN